MNEESIRKSYAENCDILRSFTEIQNNDIELQQDLQDEYFAILLQNEEFLNCLKTDRDFMDALNDEIIKSNDHHELDYRPHQDIDYSYGNGN